MSVVRKYEDFDLKTQHLLERSIVARESAYCPFSKFKVGAALVTKGGEIYTGCNVENRAYPLSTCAEHTAVVKAVSEGNTVLKEIAVCAAQNGNFVSPCGGCRQILSEFVDKDPEPKDVTIYLVKPDRSQVLVTSLSMLLPLSFKF